MFFIFHVSKFGVESFLDLFVIFVEIWYIFFCTYEVYEVAYCCADC